MNDVEASQTLVAVLGAGVIGVGVAYSCASAGHDVILIDLPSKDWAEVKLALRRHYRLDRLSQPSLDKDLLDRITFSTRLSAAHGAQVIVENVTEDWATKKDLYTKMREEGLTDAYIAVNTSAIPIGLVATEAPNPARVVGVHFMNPVPRSSMVEVVRGPETHEESIIAMTQFLSHLGKRSVVVNDTPGFVINQILMAVVDRAAEIVDAGVATAHDVDLLFKGCLGHAMGPLRTADLIGIDTIVNTLKVLQDERKDDSFAPGRRLTAMVARGELGVKSGRGFFDYTGRE
jgi:3-hydroxyacyl-CoA dehydrogenase